jgi:hypothetical protein
VSTTLQDLVILVASNLHDLVAGYATASSPGTPTIMEDDNRAGDADRYRGSEALFLQPAAGVAGMDAAGLNPKKVFDQGFGQLQFTDNWNGTDGVPAGVEYVLINIAGEGYPYAEVVRAARLALKALKPQVSVEEDAVAITPVTGNMAWATAEIPATIDFLSEVHVVRDTEDIGLIRAGDGGWRVLQGTRTLLLARTLPLVEDDTLTLHGTGPVTVPTDLEDSVDVDEEAWVNATIEFLTRADADSKGQQLAANLYMDRVRTVPQYRRPSSYKVG